MKISIYDKGPVGAKVEVIVYETHIAFPEHSVRQLVDLFTLLGAIPEPGTAKKGEIHFLLERDPEGKIDKMRSMSIWKRLWGR